MAEIDWNVSEMRKSLLLYSQESSFQRFGLLADKDAVLQKLSGEHDLIPL